MKCTFLTSQVISLGFIVSSEGIIAYLEKIKAIKEWPEPKNICDVRSFHRLPSFYCRFIGGFSTIMALITVCLKGDFIWTRVVAKTFTKIKEQMVEALVMCFSDFSKIFEVAWHTSGIGICGVLLQENHLVSYFSKKLNEAKQCYFTYDKEFYAVIQALRYW